MLIAPSILFAAAVALFVVGRFMARKARLIAGTEKASVSAIESEAKAVAAEIGGGGFAKYVEVSGKIACDSPLEAEFTQTKCVHYETTVTREYEETYVQKNSDGSSQTQTRQGTQNVSSNSRSCAFAIDDGTGKIEVDPAGAEFHLETTMSSFEPGELSRTIGTYVLNAVLAGAQGRRTIGYRFVEKCLPVDRQGYVFGEARDSGGALRIGRSQEKGRRLIISLKSAEELLRSAKLGAMWLTIAACASMTGALVILVLGMLRR